MGELAPGGTSSRSTWMSWARGAALVALVFLAYSPVYLGRGAGFIWDDGDYVVNNGNLRDLAGLWRSWTAPGSLPQWYPLVHTTYWVEHHLWGAVPRGYHVVNVALHGVAVVLLWRVLRGLGFSGWAAWLGAAVWGLHPVGAESAAWVTERKNTLMAAGYFGSGLALLRWGAGRRWGWYAVACGLYLAALTSKTVAATLPAAWVVVRWWQTGRVDWRRDVLPMVPWVIVGALFARETAYLEVHQVGAHGAEWDWTWAQRVVIAGRSVWAYVGCLAWPAGLSFIYERWTPTGAAIEWGWAMGVTAVTAGLWAMRGKIGRGPVTAAVLFVGVLFPALGFANVYPHRYSFVADHFQYVASACLLVGVGWWLARTPRAVGVALLVVLGALTAGRCLVMRDEVSLWEDASRKAPGNAMVWANLARAYRERPGTVAEKMRDGVRNVQLLSRARELARSAGLRSEISLTLGYAYEEQGATGEAERLYLEAVGEDPGDAQAWYYLGKLRRKSGNAMGAREALERAIRERPGYPEARAELGALDRRG